MAALPAGVQYGLSSESSYKENKELVFVKLTDSSLKAIHDYLKKDRSAKAKIQFLSGNEGKICIPVPTSGNGLSGEATFHFNITSNIEVEGPQGSFECVRSGGARRLESCGPLQRRIRVHATDDSYEATKDRMARTVAAEQSKCTRVIKPNQTDIGRRVKVRSAHPYSTTPAAAQIAERLERAERERIERPDRPDRPERSERSERPERTERPERPDRPERLDRPDRPDRVERPERPAPTLPTRPLPLHQPPPQTQHNPPAQRPPSNPDIGRRSLKERLIQLLALKPFKKPELYSRLTSEGLKDRTAIGKILPQISTLKDNCYHLRRHFWNDVNEDWPFYSEEEKRMLKRRKPQNLTPPLSSDSANSLSPRASPCNKRPSGATSSEEAPTSKKQRISHFRRQQSPPSSGYATTSSGERHASDNEDERTNETAKKEDKGYTLNFTTVKELCESPIKNTVINGYRGSPPVDQTKNNYRSSPPVDQTKNNYRSSPPVDQTKNGYRNSPPVDQTKNGYRSSPSVDQSKNGFRSSPPVDQSKNGYRSSPPADQTKNGYRSSPSVDQSKNGFRNSPPVEQFKNGYRNSPPVEENNITDTISNSEQAAVPSTADLKNITGSEENAHDAEEMERLYPPITSSSMRRAYKNEFSELYTEYRSAYARVAAVANLFTRLENELRRAAPHDPHHKNIEQRIVEEYRRMNNDSQYQSDRGRVNYLHRKLNHIKRMVQQYDQPRNLKQDRVSTASTTQAY